MPWPVANHGSKHSGEKAEQFISPVVFFRDVL
jgi:hypothetical protein